VVEREEIEEEEGLMIESAPPLSIYYPPSSHSSFTKLVPTALPPKSLSVRSMLVGCADIRRRLL
jgi:dynein light intermediate chain 1